ncbi:hypothetical protein KBB27_00410 [Patescibacteria group bacterium]|nr:hypothetical protein [Patescibacteria group bacterium]
MAVKFRLPEHDEMKRRLLEVDFNDDVTAGFYSRLLNRAGEEHTFESFAEAFVEAMRQYTQSRHARYAILSRVEGYARAFVADVEAAKRLGWAISRISATRGEG